MDDLSKYEFNFKYLKYTKIFLVGNFEVKRIGLKKVITLFGNGTFIRFLFLSLNKDLAVFFTLSRKNIITKCFLSRSRS